LHKLDFKKSEILLNNAASTALIIQKIINKFPKYRYGFFSNSLEEYVEAIAFKYFLQ